MKRRRAFELRIAILDADLTLLRQQFEAGEREALFQAIWHSSQNGKPLPKWATDAFAQSYATWVREEAATLGEAFEVPDRKHLGEKRKRNNKRRNELQNKVIAQVWNAQSAGLVVDEHLFESVGQKLGAGKTVVKELWYEFINGTGLKIR